MSHWNYRVCKTTYSKGTQDEEVNLAIHEVYYNSKGEINATTENSVGPSGETIEELLKSIERMRESVNKDVIDLDTIVFAKGD
jgi:hypothetical protein